MQSKTLSSESGPAAREKAPCAYFNATLFRKNLTRFWPLWALYTVIWLIMLPLVEFIERFGNSASFSTAEQLADQTASTVLHMAAEGGLWMGAIFGCLFAGVLFSYQCSARSVGMMHSFPIRREGLFLTNYLSGAAVFLGADVLTFLLTAAVQGAGGVLDWGNLLVWFACSAGMMLFFYSFAVFCAMFTGQVLAIPAFYIILNGLAAGLNFLVQNFSTVFFYGYTGGGTPKWVVWLTPVWKLNRVLQVHSKWNDVGGYSYGYSVQGLSAVAVYAAAGVALAALALLVCRTRRSETAGDTVTVGWMKPVFRYGVAVCCALSLGQGLYFLAWEQFYNDKAYFLPGVLFCMILTGLVGYFAAEMLLRKSFRVFRGGWKGAAALVIALAAFGICVSLDITGVESRVPAADTVKSLDFRIYSQNNCSGSIDDPALIEQFGAVHRQMIAEKEDQQARQSDGGNPYDSGSYGSLSLDYRLKNGAVVSRRYNFSYDDSDLQNPDSAVSLLAKLTAEPEVQRAGLLGDRDLSHITSGEMEYYVRQGDRYEYVTMDGETAQAVYTALCEDLDAGRFGVNQFNADAWARETYVNDVTLYYDAGADDVMNSVNFSFSSNCTALVAVLTKAGLVNADRPLVTCLEADPDRFIKSEAPGAAQRSTQTAVIGGADGPTEIMVEN